ncbi:hypothetical protein B4113_2128 [Geobacillus sp. B4113_201601]|nr:DUF4277 domain-containing protein [Geobacillus sp. B4113_201601]KYD24796.1 hypothetical protein B4113_2128 [Geobacillus sp. B4113_201601]
MPNSSQRYRQTNHSGYLERPRQALVHLEQWAHDIDWPKQIRLGLEPSWFNDDAIARHWDRRYEANLHQVLSSCLVQIDK